MSLDEHISRIVPILPTDCRIKKGKKLWERQKIKEMALSQLPGDIWVVFGTHKLYIKEGTLT